LGIISGTIISNANTSKWWKISIPLLVFAFSTWYIVGGYQYWFNYLDGTFTGEVEEPMPQDWYTVTKGNDTLRADFYKDKIIFFDFWNTSCVICFRKFPDTERLYQKYKHHKNFIVQAVNIPIERDTAGMAFYMFERKNKYSFPAVMGNEVMRVKFKVEAYPTIVVMKNDTVLFRGRMELVENFLDKTLK
jgi:thiol-disulfide isomerase/thioredoxin